MRKLITLALAVILAALITGRSDGESVEVDTNLDITSMFTFDNGDFLVGGWDGSLRLYSGNRVLWSFRSDNAISNISATSDGNHVVCGSDNQMVYLLDKSGNQIWEFDAGESVTAVDMVPGYVAVGTWNGRVLLLDEERNVIWEENIGHRILSLDIDAQNMYLAVGTRDSRIRLFEIPEGKFLWEAILPSSVYNVGIGRKMIVASTKDTIRALDFSGGIVWDFSSTNRINCIGISDREGLIAIGTDRGFNILNVRGITISEHKGPKEVVSLAFSSDGNKLALGDTGGKVYIYDRSLLVAAQVSQRRLPYVIIGLILFTSFIILERSGKLHCIGRHLYILWRHRQAYLFILPTLTLLIIFSYYPAFSGLYHAFTEWAPGAYTKFVGLRNFNRLLEDSYFWRGIDNLVILLITGILKVLTIPLIVAELIFQLKSNRAKYVYRTLFVIPMVVPSMVNILLWRMIYNPSIGLVNQTLIALGFKHFTRAWLAQEDTALWSIIFMGFPWAGVTAFLIYYAGLIGIPLELIDAAKVDGATWFKRFIYVDIPMLMGQIRLLIILTLIGTLQDFQSILVMTGGGPGEATYVPALEMYYTAFQQADFGYASAIGLLLFITILIGTVINMRYGKVPKG